MSRRQILCTRTNYLGTNPFSSISSWSMLKWSSFCFPFIICLNSSTSFFRSLSCAINSGVVGGGVGVGHCHHHSREPRYTSEPTTLRRSRLKCSHVPTRCPIWRLLSILTTLANVSKRLFRDNYCFLSMYFTALVWGSAVEHTLRSHV